MGVYASYDDVHHPTQAWELAEHCTACRNTGWVAYPVNVGVDEVEYDACPHGCKQMDEDERKDYYVRVHPSQNIIPDEQWATSALAASYRPEADTDPFLILENHRRELVFYAGKHTPLAESDLATDAMRVQGRITTDEPVTGYLGAGRFDLPECTIPAYLVGTPTSVSDMGMVVQYEYLGSKVDVYFGPSSAAQFRFAYGFEGGFSTSELMR